VTSHIVLRAQRICGWVLITLAVGLGIAAGTSSTGPGTTKDGAVAVDAPPGDVKGSTAVGWTINGYAFAGCLAMFALGVVLVIKSNRVYLDEPPAH
jgi:hypothetical protein